MTGPKFVVPTLGIVCPKKLLDDLKSGKYYILNVLKGHLDVGDRCLRSNVLCLENHQYNENVASIRIRIPKSQMGHHHKVTNITVSSTSLSPF